MSSFVGDSAESSVVIVVGCSGGRDVGGDVVVFGVVVVVDVVPVLLVMLLMLALVMSVLSLLLLLRYAVCVFVFCNDVVVGGVPAGVYVDVDVGYVDVCCC